MKSWGNELCHSVLYCYHALLDIFSFPVTSLAEQAKARGRQDQEVRRMTMELKAAISDRDSFKKSHQALGEEMEKVKAELALTQAK